MGFWLIFILLFLSPCLSCCSIHGQFQIYHPMCLSQCASQWFWLQTPGESAPEGHCRPESALKRAFQLVKGSKETEESEGEIQYDIWVIFDVWIETLSVLAGFWMRPTLFQSSSASIFGSHFSRCCCSSLLPNPQPLLPPWCPLTLDSHKHTLPTAVWWDGRKERWR